MIGGSQVLLEGLQSMMQDGLTGRKKVLMTLAFLSYGLFLQFLHKPYMPQTEKTSRQHSCQGPWNRQFPTLGVDCPKLFWPLG